MSMSIKEKYKVTSIDSNITHDWLLNKHYAKRLPSISFAFGLYGGGYFVGRHDNRKASEPIIM